MTRKPTDLHAGYKLDFSGRCGFSYQSGQHLTVCFIYLVRFRVEVHTQAWLYEAMSLSYILLAQEYRFPGYVLPTKLQRSNSNVRFQIIAHIYRRSSPHRSTVCRGTNRGHLAEPLFPCTRL